MMSIGEEPQVEQDANIQAGQERGDAPETREVEDTKPSEEVEGKQDTLVKTFNNCPDIAKDTEIVQDWQRNWLLAAISAGRLHTLITEGKYGGWSKFCEDVLDLPRSRVSQLETALRMRKMLEDAKCKSLPEKELVYRVLAKVKDSKAAVTAWKEFQLAHGSQKYTAKMLEAFIAANYSKPKDAKKPADAAKAPGKGVSSLVEALKTLRASHTREEILQALDEVDKPTPPPEPPTPGKTETDSDEPAKSNVTAEEVPNEIKQVVEEAAPVTGGLPSLPGVELPPKSIGLIRLSQQEKLKGLQSLVRKDLEVPLDRIKAALPGLSDKDASVILNSLTGSRMKVVREHIKMLKTPSTDSDGIHDASYWTGGEWLRKVDWNAALKMLKDKPAKEARKLVQDSMPATSPATEEKDAQETNPFIVLVTEEDARRAVDEAYNSVRQSREERSGKKKIKAQKDAERDKFEQAEMPI